MVHARRVVLDARDEGAVAVPGAPPGLAQDFCHALRDAALRLAESVGAAYRAEAAALDAVAPPPYA